MEPWQQSFADEFVRLDGEGQRIFKRGLLGIARGNGKSPLVLGLALRELFAADDSPSDVFLAAASRDQARIVFEYARGFVESGPLAGLFEVGRNEIRNPANSGVLRTISADGYVQHGLNPSSVVIDELHAWQTDKQRELAAVSRHRPSRPSSPIRKPIGGRCRRSSGPSLKARSGAAATQRSTSRSPGRPSTGSRTVTCAGYGNRPLPAY